MLGLSRELVEHRLPICERKMLVKKAPRRFALNVMEVINAKIERLLKANFIQTIRCVCVCVCVCVSVSMMRVCVCVCD